MNLIKDIHHYLAEEMEQLNGLIISYLDSKEELIELVSKHLIEGKSKRLRPILTILTAKMFNHESNNTIKLAAAVEFIHTATLLHDDVVDDSKMRRFRPTANLIWGNKASILVGDFLFSQSFKLMVATNSIEALEVLSNASAIIAEGEVAQLEKLNAKCIISSAEYHRIIKAKTAELFGAACAVGAIIAGQPENISNALKNFGTNLGNIFQIADDCLDYFGDSENIGKNSGDDFFEGKVTLPLILTYEKLQLDDKKKVDEMLQADVRTTENFNWILKKMEQLEIKRQIMNHLNALNLKTTTLLENNVAENQAKDYLLGLVNFAMSRTY